MGSLEKPAKRSAEPTERRSFFSLPYSAFNCNNVNGQRSAAQHRLHEAHPRGHNLWRTRACTALRLLAQQMRRRWVGGWFGSELGCAARAHWAKLADVLFSFCFVSARRSVAAVLAGPHGLHLIAHRNEKNMRCTMVTHGPETDAANLSVPRGRTCTNC